MKCSMEVINKHLLTVSLLLLSVIVGGSFSHNAAAGLKDATDSKTIIIPQVSYPGTWGNQDPWLEPVNVTFNTDTHTYEVSMIPVLSAVHLSCYYSLMGEQTRRKYTAGRKDGLAMQRIKFSFEDNSRQDKRYELNLSCANEDSPIFSASGTAFISNVNIHYKGH